MFRAMTRNLLEHGSIVTTRARALELRRHFEPLVTLARKDLTLARRRQLLAQLTDKQDLERLVAVAQKFQGRPGGYLRVTKLVSSRHDQAEMAQVALVAEEAAEAK